MTAPPGPMGPTCPKCPHRFAIHTANGCTGHGCECNTPWGGADAVAYARDKAREEAEPYDRAIERSTRGVMGPTCSTCGRKATHQDACPDPFHLAAAGARMFLSPEDVVVVKDTGPMGTTCPQCGRFWRARGCTPTECKSTPEPAAPEGAPPILSRPEIELPPQRLVPEVVARMIVTSHLSAWGPFDVRRNRDLTALILAVAAGIAEDRRTPAGPHGPVIPEEMASAAPDMLAMLRSVIEELDDPDGRIGALRMRMEMAGLRALLDRIDRIDRAGK